MAHSVLDLFSIGIGPSSSHTVGPMRAAFLFSQSLCSHPLSSHTGEPHTEAGRIARVVCDLYGSLALTGKGHGTDDAIILGLSGYKPDATTTTDKQSVLSKTLDQKSLLLNKQYSISFDAACDIRFLKSQLMPKHPNGLTIKAFDQNDKLIKSAGYYSVGGGFICDEEGNAISLNSHSGECPFPFNSTAELITHCRQQACSISELMLKNECAWRSESEVKTKLIDIWSVMNDSIEAGLNTEGTLPGGLNVKRRAPHLYQKLSRTDTNSNSLEPDSPEPNTNSPEPNKNGPVPDNNHATILDWLSVYAMAVNEENAAGGRVVTAPTNGAAGIMPAVLKYTFEHLKPYNEQDVINYLLTAGAIGILYKEGASLSAAEVGCQGEVGVACSMAAGALAAIKGGSIWQVENAAEIGMEHNLGLTCDPIGGLVQIPCIERNTMGAVKAVNAAHLALNADGRHLVSLDKVIATMMRTGRDMQHQYKETSLGGLAIQVNMPEC